MKQMNVIENHKMSDYTYLCERNYALRKVVFQYLNRQRREGSTSKDLTLALEKESLSL